MATDHNIKTFTASDIEKYHKGLLSTKEMHAMEKAALDDPFLADAMEGYALEKVNVTDDITELKKRLAARIEEDDKVVPIAGRRNYLWLKIAAIVILVAGGGLLVYQLGFKKENTIAQSPAANKEKEAAPATVKTDTIKENTVANSSSPTENSNAETSTNDKLVSTSKPAKQEAARQEEALEGDIQQADTVVVVGYGAQRKKDMTGAVAKVTATKEGERTDDKAKEKDIHADRVKDSMDKDLVAKSTQQNNAKAFLSEYKQSPRNIFRGRITDSSNNPLPFANITNTEDNVGTYADAKGNFVLTSPDSVLRVQVRSIGFSNNYTTLQGNVTSNNVKMKEDYSGLTEVVISRNRNLNSNRSRSTMVLEEPEPEDGWDNYDTYLANNLNEPEKFRSKLPQGGEVEISFEVNADGEPVNIKVEKSLCDSCDKEAIRLVKEGPKFKRKAKKGKRTTVAVSF